MSESQIGASPVKIFSPSFLILVTLCPVWLFLPSRSPSISSRAGRPRSQSPPGWAAHLQKVVPSCPSCLFFKIVGIGWSLSEQTPPPKKFSNHWKTHENFSNHWKTRPPPPGCRIVQKPSVSMDIIGFGNGLGVQVACSPMIRQKELFNR